MFEDDTTEEPQHVGGRRINVPTVLASAGVSATISALIVTIGVVGVLISDDRKVESPASAALPTVVNLGSAATPSAVAAPQQVAPSAVPSAAASGGADATTGGGATGGGISGGGTSGGGATGGGVSGGGVSGGGVSGGTQGTGGGAQSTAPSAAAAPQALSTGQLESKLKVLLTPGASTSAKAAELEGGAAGIPSSDAVARALKLLAGPGFRWRVSTPVSVNGSVLNARLITSAPGFNDLSQPISWVWKDGAWKLSNKSTCMLASYAQARCTV